MGLESISEPDNMDIDDNNNDKEEAQDDGADELFFNMHDGTRSSSTCRSIFVANQAQEHHTMLPAIHRYKFL